MEFLPASERSLEVFLFVLALVVALFLAGVHAASRHLGAPAGRRTALCALGLAAWLGLDAAWVASGVIAARPMPHLPVFFALNNLAALALALSPVGGWLSRGLPLSALVGFQAFRLPLEIVLHDWARQGTIPVTMTWEGSNFDYVSGLVAIVAAPLATRSRAAAWIANAVGFALLANVARVAILSSPLPFAWQVTPPLELAAHLPYALIVPVAIGGALAGHVVLTRALLRKD
jgi:hypothetical protein